MSLAWIQRAPPGTSSGETTFVRWHGIDKIVFPVDVKIDCSGLRTANATELKVIFEAS